MRGDRIEEGTHPPSSEYPFHRAIYERRPDIRAVLHAHPAALVAFSLVRSIPDTSIIPQARAVCGAVGYAPYAIPGSEELGRNLAGAFGQGFDTVLLENHGVATGGTISSKPSRGSRPSTSARGRSSMRARSAPPRGLHPEQIALSRQGKNYQLQEFDPPSRTSAERSLRRDIRELVHRAYRQRLMTSTEGTVSARVDGDPSSSAPMAWTAATWKSRTSC